MLIFSNAGIKTEYDVNNVNKATVSLSFMLLQYI